MADSSRGRVVVVEDEAFTRNLVAGSLIAEGWQVEACETIAQALSVIEACEPNAVMCDLDLGAGPSGVDLCRRLAEDYPWIGLVVLTAHTSSELAVPGSVGLPAEVVYVVKSTVGSPGELSAAIEAAIGGSFNATSGDARSGTIEVSAEQGEVLRLLARAYSNTAIAEERGTSVRAAEAMVQRIFVALGIENQPETNSRVAAANMWDSGRIMIR